MATEIFLQPELEEIITDADKKAEWEEKVTSLGLKGQIKLTQHNDKKAASPYTFMNKQMELVFRTICPAKMDYLEYDKSAIPIDVLSHLALCKQESYFSKIEIWYDDKNPDPIVVGHIGSTYSTVKHLIARWGDEIIPFEQLIEKAKQRFAKTYKSSLETLKIKVDASLASVEFITERFFAGEMNEWDVRPSFQSTGLPL